MGYGRRTTGRDRNEAGGWPGLDRNTVFGGGAQKTIGGGATRVWLRRRSAGRATGHVAARMTAAARRCLWNSSRGSGRLSSRSASWEQCIFGTIHHGFHHAPDGMRRQVRLAYNLVGPLSGRCGEAMRKGGRGKRSGATTDEQERIKTLEKKNRELRQANEIFVGRRPILPRRSSTARFGNDRLHRRAPRRPRGRADLQSAADRPVHLPRP